MYYYIHSNINKFIFFRFCLFKLNENYEVDRKILKRDYVRYSPAETSTINTPNSQI